jgi:uncharacterized membrane protein
VSADLNEIPRQGTIAWLPAAAAIVSLIGLVDAIYLTIHHYTAAPVPCSIIHGCEEVLSSPYAELWGVPLAGFGIAAYFLAFSFALMAAFGDSRMWKLFGVQVTLMAVFTCWLIYLQAVVIEAFCQFCLLSAATTFILFILFVLSLVFRRRT